MNNYQIYISDASNNSVQLDSENIDFKSVFAISDLTDIQLRKDNVKTITIKGTKNNIAAFGNFFNLGRTSNLANTGSGLFYNYNSLVTVLALIYEDSMLIFKGSLRIDGGYIDGKGSEMYNCIVTGSYIDFKATIQDLLLTDLDFSDLKHRYNTSNIVNSWNVSTERFSGGNYSSSVYADGSGYVYPNIDYGNVYSPTITGTNVNQVNMKNYKPAIFLREYMNRIFSQPLLSGFSYEIKASPEFINQFNKIIIPDCSESLKQNFTNTQFNYSQASGTSTTETGKVTGVRASWKLIPLTAVAVTGSSVTNLLQPYNNLTDILSVLRPFTATASINVIIAAINNQTDGNGAGMPCIVHVEMVKRTVINDDNPTSGWSVLVQNQFNVPYGSSITQTVTANAGINAYTTSDQLAIRVRIELISSTSTIAANGVTYNVTSAMLSLPGTTTDVLSATLLPTNLGGDSIMPAAAANIKQVDFIKSIMLQFNWYAYTTNDNYKRIIFQKYDDYYALTSPGNVIISSLDWSGKIDYSKKVTVKSNLSLPKSYIFTYKKDVDSLSDYYYNKFNTIYGQKNFDDGLGLIAQKKIELIFSSCIPTSYTGTNRKVLALYKVSTGSVQTTKTNIRLCYYNGLQPCQSYSINNEEVSTGGVVSLATYYTGNSYAQASNYLLDSSGNTVSDLHFDVPLEYYTAIDSTTRTATASYKNCYQNQISELTNPNIKFYDFDILLNENDISNLNLQVPIFIETGNGAAYFKILSVEYNGNTSISKIKLQTISF